MCEKPTGLEQIRQEKTLLHERVVCVGLKQYHTDGSVYTAFTLVGLRSRCSAAVAGAVCGATASIVR